jgi:hypothetical protein
MVNWNLPPGVTDKMIDEQFAPTEQDECCGCYELTEFKCPCCATWCCEDCVIEDRACADCYDGPTDEQLANMPTREELEAAARKREENL